MHQKESADVLYYLFELRVSHIKPKQNCCKTKTQQQNNNKNKPKQQQTKKQQPQDKTKQNKTKQKQNKSSYFNRGQKTACL